MNEEKKIPAFKLWLEYNPYDEPAPDLSDWDMENEFCNIGVDLLDGRYYGINVWTYKYFETVIEQDRVSTENLSGAYVDPPDLFVKDLTKDCIEAAIGDLLSKGDLEWLLNPSVFSIRFKPPWTDVNDLEDRGDAIEKELGLQVTAGHVLYGRNPLLLAVRNDTEELALQLNDKSIALLKQGEVVEIFRSKEDFWKLRLKNDISSGEKIL